MPANPRKSDEARLTHCTGIRNGLSSAERSTSTSSRYSISVGPSYHGVCSLRSRTLAPRSADTGMHDVSP